jgi:hypothetical protein
MRNSSLVKSLRAENLPGLSAPPNPRTGRTSGCARSGRGASRQRRSLTVRAGGAGGSENAGVSNDMGWESPSPIGRGFQGKVRPPWVSRGLRGSRKACPMDSRSIFLRPGGSDAVTEQGGGGRLLDAGGPRHTRRVQEHARKGKRGPEERGDPSTKRSPQGSPEKPLAVSRPART